MVRLHVNVDHVATLRQQRDGRSPDPVTAAALCEHAGADGITVHLREDRRHVQERDVRLLRETVVGTFNLEMAAVPEMVAIACAVRPDVCTLVPERRAERTTEGGLDARALPGLGSVVAELRDAGIEVSLFLDPDPEAVRVARAIGATTVELHTGEYCHARAGSERAGRELGRLRAAGAAATEAGLKLAAGHGLDVSNVGPVAALPGMQELNIGFSIVAQAVLVGLPQAVRDMRAAIAAGLTARGA